MKRILSILITCALFALLLTCMTLTALAVPPAPNSGWGQGAACRSHASGTLVTLDSLPASRSVPEPRCAPGADGQKTIPLLTIVIGFSDRAYDDTFDWNATIYSGERSLQAYYTDMSGGQFTFTPIAETSAYGVDGNTNAADAANDGVVHVALDMPHGNWVLDYYDDDTEMAEMSAMTMAFIDAVTVADDYVDFSAYDCNGDGAITTDEMALAFVVAGWEAAYDSGLSMGKSYYIWSHAWDLGSACYYYCDDVEVPTPDGVEVSSYISIAEYLTNTKQEPISVLAHELGHYLGLPDLYDTRTNSMTGSWASYDVSYLSVMCSGSWGYDPVGGANSYVPHSFDAWSKTALGWVEPATAENNAEYTLADVSESGGILLIETGREKEYYLVENRRFTGWDAGMAYEYSGSDGGLVIWHIDGDVYDRYVGSNGVNNGNHRPAIMPLYPEKKGSAYSYIGSNDRVLTNKPFHDMTSWRGGAGVSLGDSLDLPLYGAGNNADNRASRTLSGIYLTFTSDSADEMTFTIGNPSGGHVHTLVYMPEEPATCVDPGVKAHYVCSECGERFLDEAGRQPATDEDLRIPPTGRHTYSDWVETLAPTCGAPGEKQRVCSVCGKIQTQKLPATGEHTFGDWAETLAPTCVAAGEKSRVCSGCGKTETEPLPATGVHTFGDWTVVTAPTCGASGETKRVCSGCGRTETAVVPPNGAHVWGEPAVAAEPTCTAAGKLVMACTVCGAEKEEQLAPLGHTDADGDGYCDRDGADLAGSSRCALCGKVHTGFFGGIVGFFHRIVYFFRNLFR